MSVSTDASAKAKSTASKASTTAKSTASKASSTAKSTASKARSTAKSTAPTATEARKPFYAYVGLADLAVETAKTVPGELAKLQEQVKSFPGVVLTLPASVKNLQDRGIEFYAELATRGEKLVTAIRKQPSTERVAQAASDTVRSARGTATLVSKTLRAGEKAAEDASAKIG